MTKTPFAICKKKQWTIANKLNENVKALMMFHAITGCDTVSGFHGKGKKLYGQHGCHILL